MQKVKHNEKYLSKQISRLGVAKANPAPWLLNMHQKQTRVTSALDVGYRGSPQVQPPVHGLGGGRTSHDLTTKHMPCDHAPKPGCLQKANTRSRTQKQSYFLWSGKKLPLWTLANTKNGFTN